MKTKLLVTFLALSTLMVSGSKGMEADRQKQTHRRSSSAGDTGRTQLLQETEDRRRSEEQRHRVDKLLGTAQETTTRFNNSPRLSIPESIGAYEEEEEEAQPQPSICNSRYSVSREQNLLHNLMTTDGVTAYGVVITEENNRDINNALLEVLKAITYHIEDKTLMFNFRHNCIAQLKQHKDAFMSFFRASVLIDNKEDDDDENFDDLGEDLSSENLTNVIELKTTAENSAHSFTNLTQSNHPSLSMPQSVDGQEELNSDKQHREEPSTNFNTFRLTTGKPVPSCVKPSEKSSWLKPAFFGITCFGLGIAACLYIPQLFHHLYR